jgi:DNA-binding CsgD family transcriptional regulator
MNIDIHATNKSALEFITNTSSRVRVICEPLKHLGIDCFYYRRVYNDCKYLTLSNGHEEYHKQYFENIKKSDPQFIKAFNLTPYNEPHFCLWPTKSKILPPIVSLQNMYNIWHGFGINYRKEEYCEVFCFAFNTQTNSKEQFYFQNIYKLVKFCNFFRIQVADLLERDKSKIAVYAEKFDLSYIGNDNKNSFITDIDKNFGLRSQNGNLVYLTKREFESLKLVANNKTVKEVAHLLNLSPRTVEAYINNLKLKVGVNYKNQLIDIFNDSYY